ncbi:acyl-CoA thioesterase [Planktosalinus lacus]|uniref:Thioesterase n=1 Tax=Planktosalinus lacus TaxID=1526573 RepID=A0A8J2V822_9FLAO|nr:thioesterase family protein [Planktosalinus lacus]GGD82043.1 thioesterase [Planktosalinus lacus]
MNHFQTEITVPASAIDNLNHVNNVVYLQWIQDVAAQHWNESTDFALREKLAWVVVNHFIEYKAPAFEKDVLILKTRVEKYSGVTSERHTEIIRKADNKLLVKAKTLWCLLDKNTGKPMRITDDLIAKFP